jgi:solute carrier family 34 (sodium-dependent phosphate cotransporter)
LTDSNSIQPSKPIWHTVRMAAYVIGALLLFFFAIDLMVSSLQHLGQAAAETIILATSNPFTGLFIGLLITAMIQSSSTTTAMVVALVASGSITLESAVPIIMGANVGTTITSTIVSLGFINKRKEFRRAVAAGTYHDFFNILTVIILFPLEYYYNFLSGLSSTITSYFFADVTKSTLVQSPHFFNGFAWIIDWLIATIRSGFVLALLSFVLVFTSILIFRKLIADWMLVRSPERFGRFFFRNPAKSFVWGFLTTAAIRSSTITTSLVVPLVAKRFVRLKQAAPFILGANVGTTVTAFIAATLYANSLSAITIATAHFLFNFIGVLIFLPIPALRNIPIDLANYLGKLTLKYRLVGLVYLLLTFFFIPFSLIYLNRDAVETTEVIYEKRNELTNTLLRNKVVLKINKNTKTGEWIEYRSDSVETNTPYKIYPLYFKNNVLFVKGGMIMFAKPGFCWDGENEKGKYQICVETIHQNFMLPTGDAIDSVYECRLHFYKDASLVNTTLHISPLFPFVLQETKIDSATVLETTRVVGFTRE